MMQKLPKDGLIMNHPLSISRSISVSISKFLLSTVCLVFLATGCMGYKSSKPQAVIQPSIEVETLAQTTSSWNGNTLPGYPQGQPQVTILKIIIPPGFELPLHQHPVINAGVLLSE